MPLPYRSQAGDLKLRRQNIGPLGLAFADGNTLVVGDGSQEDGKEIVRIYTVGAQPPLKDKVRQALSGWPIEGVNASQQVKTIECALGLDRSRESIALRSRMRPEAVLHAHAEPCQKQASETA